MRPPIGAAFAAAICFTGLLLGAQADFIYDLSVSGGWTGSGSIAFDTLTGTDIVFSDIAGVSAFSFHVSSGFGSPQDYDLGDLASVDWSIDPASFDLSLLLSAALVPFARGSVRDPPDQPVGGSSGAVFRRRWLFRTINVRNGRWIWIWRCQFRQQPFRTLGSHLSPRAHLARALRSGPRWSWLDELATKGLTNSANDPRLDNTPRPAACRGRWQTHRRPRDVV